MSQALNEERTEEQAIVDASLNFRRALHVVRLKFPNMSYAEILVYTGAVECAASASLGQSISQAGARLDKQLSGTPSPSPSTPKKGGGGGTPVGKRIVERVDLSDSDKRVVLKDKPKAAKSSPKKATVRATPMPAQFLDRIALVVGAVEAMSISDVLTELKKRRWMPESKNPASYVGTTMSQAKDLFENTARGVYRVKATKKAQAFVAKLKTVPAEEPAPNGKPDRDAVLRFLVAHGRPVAAPDIAKNVGLDNAQSLTPLLVALREYGGLKTKSGDHDQILWEPIVESLKRWDAERNHGTAFSHAQENVQNGVAQA